MSLSLSHILALTPFSHHHHRRAAESELVHDYYTELMSHLASKGITEDYTYEQCFQEYIEGGFGRWCWFLGAGKRIFGGDSPFGVRMQRFFHDQLAAFAHDHILNPKDAPMPRV